MNTCQEIIDRAHAKLGIKGAYQALDSTQSATGLRALKSVYRHLITSGAFGELCEVMPTASMTAQEYTRITTDGTVTITLPASISPTIQVEDFGEVGFLTDNAYVRPPRDGTVVTVTNTGTATGSVVNGSTTYVNGPGTTLDFIYDGQIKQWLSVESLSYSSVAPLSRRDDNGLCALLATNLADEYGQQITPLIQLHARGFALGITQNWSQAGEEIIRGEYF